MNKSKLNKDQIQKIVLSGMGFVVLLYVYFNFFLAPLAKSRSSIEKTTADLQAKIAASSTEIPKAAKLENEAGAATARFAAFEALSPEGAPIAWFPPRIKVFFANQQIDKVTARLASNSDFTHAALTKWSRYIWSLDLPQTDFVTFGKAIAQLENSEPLLTITHISIRGGGDNPEFQTANLTASTAILKR